MISNTDLLNKLNFFTEPGFKEELLKHGQVASFNKGDVIVRDGQYVKFLPIVLKGSIRVFQQSEDREILLYYVRADETCTMSLAAAYFNNKSTSHGVVTEPTDVLIFPASMIEQWQLKYPSWNRYMMQMFRTRYDQLISSFQGVAFENIDTRVMEYLKETAKKGEGKSITLSHQQLADELGTTRVVISRILKDYERQNKIKLFRGRIELIS
ncbi:Crp/Fnr family transcriptional regulator [Mucilaginibacter sp. BT774]|uniref:Crp/Fnr family transcriptional regulator n=1 Tax=Mucilaginibacter sp. BT774 TaxID=3062276 RepID=UPI002676908B|nr:Crp/Fnr family transcriptional regulator [Mucilaginibacter sp. BT774]MDO3625832.1 Crp/Fnr family transcriptional regulator [Mucilaginibacter sp. BT774]